MMSFLSDFHWKKVYDEQKNELGNISWVVFDIVWEKIVGCVFKKMFLKYDYFLLSEILSNKKEEIIIKNESKEERILYDLILKQVRDDFSWVIWNIEDIEFDRLNWELKYIIIDCGYNLTSIEVLSPTKISIKKNIIKVSKKAILSYEKDYILIENKRRIKENKKTLENISKIFINIPNPSYNINPITYDKL